MKHAIFKKSIVGYVLEAPNGGVRAGQHRRVYRAVANRAECGAMGCQVVEQRELVAAVDNKPRDGDYHINLTAKATETLNEHAHW